MPLSDGVMAAAPAALGILGSLALLSDGGTDGAGFPSDALKNPRESFTERELALIDEHCRFGLPDSTNLLIRQGYVASYDARHRIPRWVAYHVKPDYRRTPERKNSFATFRSDRELKTPVGSADYTNTGFARGHLAPYGVMGGDRDNDGLTAADGDEFEFATILSANFMSNMAPQWHEGFNGAPGLWFNLERWIQDKLVRDSEQEVWIMAGGVFTTENPQQIGRKDDISVPDMFFKMVITEIDGTSEVLCFLFPHQKRKSDDLTKYLVPIDYVEALTGLDFFADLADEEYEAVSSKIRYDEKFADRFPANFLRP